MSGQLVSSIIRRRGMAAAMATFLAVALLTGWLAGPGAVRPLRAGLDALAALAGRSPGERAPGAVGKARRLGKTADSAAPDTVGPAVERALGKIFPAQFPDLPIVPIGPIDSVTDLTALPPVPAGPGGGPIAVGPGPIPVIGGGGGGGGSPRPAPTDSPSDTPTDTPTGTPTTPAVPGTPSSPGTPSTPGTPSSPGTPTTPSTPTAPDTPAPVGGVPEPEAWLLAVAGFGLLGAALRRRRGSGLRAGG